MRNLVYAFTLLFVLISFQISAQAPLKGRDESISGSQSFAIVVGVSRYKYIRPLAYADKDAELFRDWLRSPAGGKLKDDNIFCLLNDQANNSNFWGKGFQWLKKKDLQSGDKLFIYLAGHGDAIDEDQYFFLGYDCKPDGDKNNYLVSGAIQLFNLKKKIAKETSKGVDVIFIMDACRSNELPGGTSGQNFLNTAVSQKQTGEIMMLATAAGEESVEDASIGNGHGLFTWYLVDGLTGLADAGPVKDNRISFHEISNYVDTNVHSLALQRFKRKQDPYFCCDENSEKIVSQVDSDYLEQWQRIKKLQEKRSGRNSIGEIEELLSGHNEADTVLIETYNRFNRAVKNNRLSGNESAEDFLQQLNKKYPGNPYTLDAKSTLAVEYLNVAQTRVNRYLGCTPDFSVSDKQTNYEIALNLEKAIASFREDDEDFANSLYGRLYLLKASGDFGPTGRNGDMSAAFRFAYNGLAFDPNGAYIHNKLAQLHLQNNNRDSALFYANKAVKTAPNWACAVTTLALIQQSIVNNERTNKPVQEKKRSKIPDGYFIGAGINRSDPVLGSNPNSSIISSTAESKPRFELGMCLFRDLSKNILIRPAVSMSYQSTSIEFQRRPATGGQIITESLTINEVILGISPGFIYKFNSKNITPYIIVGPSINYSLSKHDPFASALVVKQFSVLGDVGLGCDFNLNKGNLIVSPELKISNGFTDLKKTPGTVYTESLSSLGRNIYSFYLYIRKK